MRTLLTRTTLGVATIVAATVMSLGATTGAPWALLTVRAASAFAIVAAAGWLIGWILMRTAIRRWYEERRLARAESRSRGHR